MQMDPREYRKHDWIIHETAADFHLIDCWELTVDLGEESFSRFFELFIGTDPATSSWITGLLLKTRFVIGKILRFDDAGSWLPIPGTNELSISGRISGEHLKSNQLHTICIPTVPWGEFRPVYLLDTEALIEVSNRTVFALIHVGRTQDRKLLVGIFIKSRGVLTKVYMGLIKPFRHRVVYPLWLGHLAVQWELATRH